MKRNLPENYIGTFRRQVKFMKLVGIDIFDGSNHFVKKYGRLIIFNIFLTHMFVGQILYVVKKDEIGVDFLEVVSAIPTIFVIIQDYVKMLIVSRKTSEIRDVIIKMGEIWPKDIGNGEKLKIVSFWIKRLRTFDNVFYSGAIICLILVELLPLAFTIYDINTKTGAEYLFPLQIYYFCFTDSHFKYMLAYVYQCVVFTLVHMCVYISCEFLLVDLIFDLIALYSILKVDLENIVQHTETSNFNFEEDNCEDIKYFVVLHQKLLSIAEDVNDIFGIIIFSQVSLSSVMICCYGFMAMLAKGQFVKYMTTTMGLMFEIFILSYPGQVLADTSSAISDAAYNCYWTMRSKRFRLFIVTIMARSQKPCRLSALGFADLTLNMFSKVLSTSWSYLSLLNKMYNDTDL